MQIKEVAAKLKLPYPKENYQALIDEALHTKMEYQDFLKKVLVNELALRKENGIARRLRHAKFPIKKYLENSYRNKYDAEFKREFDELETLGFIANKENVILIGTPGAGKTHYSITPLVLVLRPVCVEKAYCLFQYRI
jgi:DNA replication protein DnaC